MKKLLHIITNKFLLTAIVFVVWMAYFDANDWFAQERRRQELRDVEHNITYLNKQIDKMEEELDGMKNDPAVLEQVAREKYHMKRDNEDVYVFE